MRKVLGENGEEATLVGGEMDLQAEIAKQSDAIKAGITAGDIVARINDVNRKVEGKPFRKNYLQLVPTNLKGCLALAGGVETSWKPTDEGGEFDGASLTKDFFYGNDLGVKSKESQRLAVLVEGPDKAKLAAAKQLAKAFGITEEAALAKINEMGQ